MMAIYNLDGDLLDEAFSVNAESLYEAYDVNGSVVFRKDHSYDNYEIVNIGGDVHSGYVQGIDVYDDYLAIWNGGSRVRLFNVNTLTEIASIDTPVRSHGNDISFSSTFFAETDKMPLLYVETSLLRLYQVNGAWTSSVAKEISTPGLYGMRIAEAFRGNTLITIGYTEAQYTYSETNRLIIALWDMNDLTPSGSGYIPRLISTVERGWIECIQGASYRYGLLWCSSGVGGNNGHIYALDIQTGDIVVDIDTNNKGELEGLAWAHNDTDGWYILFGQVGVGFRKIVFK